MTDSIRGPSSDQIWPAGITNLLAEARNDVEQLLSNREMERAVELSARTGMSFDASCNPMYFTGAFESSLVLVHLNPKLGEKLAGYRYEDFGDYCAKHRKFGELHWGLDPSFHAPFDLKQVRFLRPFGVIDFLPTTKSDHQRSNAAMAIDGKLQLELIPYASQKFETSKLSKELLKVHIDRVLAAIVAFPRQYVIFCGAVFDNLLDSSGLLSYRRDHQFHVPTKNRQSKSKYQFSNVKFLYEGVEVRAGVARSFATQGIPMDAYGLACSRLYGKDDVADE